MNDREKKQLALLGGGALFVALWNALQRGRVRDVDELTFHDVPETVFTAAHEAALARYDLALINIRNMMGADSNTLASRNPTPTERSYIEETLALGRKLAAETRGAVTEPVLEVERYALAQKLPGDALQKVNAEFYALLGVTPGKTTSDASRDGINVPTQTLTPATEQRARSLIERWRPYSPAAVSMLFYLLDSARELGGEEV